MKTFQRVLCVMLSVLMVFGCFSVAASAAEGEKFTSTLRTYSVKSNKDNAKATLDKLDELLAGLNDGKGIYFQVIEGIAVDLRSVNALCGTLDLFQEALTTDKVYDIFTTAALKAALGQLGKDINLYNWKKDMSRTGDDVTILNELIEFLSDNRLVISGIINGLATEEGYDMGVVNNFVDLKELLGEGGISKMLKELIVGIVYKKGSAEFNSAMNGKIDDFIYEDLIGSLTKDILPGLTVDSASKIEELLVDVYNISFEKYIKDAFKSINVDLANSTVPQLKALNGKLNLNGSSYNTDGLTLDRSKSIKSQFNDIVGRYIKNIVIDPDDPDAPDFTWTEGGYENLRDNIENTIRYIANIPGVIENADKKSIEEIGAEIVLIIVNNGSFGGYEDGLADCDSLEEMVAVYAMNASREMKTGAVYNGTESYLVPLGDLLASWIYDLFPIKDTSGKIYRPGGGKDIFEVANYIVNYFMFDRGFAKTMGFSFKNTDSFFTKLDKIVDYFGENGQVNFNSKEFFLGSDSKKGLLDSILALDIAGILDLTIISAIDNAGKYSAVEFIYNSVQYFFNNWASGKKLFPDYKAYAFENALSDVNIANTVSILLETLGSRNTYFVTALTSVLALVFKPDENLEYAIESASVSDCYATGTYLAPKATVKAGGKTLTQGTDFVVYTKAVAPGLAKATIKGVGLYSGEIERDFSIFMDKVNTVSYTSTDKSLKLSWNKVAFADKYIVSKYDSATKQYKQIAEVTDATYTDAKLSASSEYKYTVQAVSALYGSSAAKAVTAYTSTAAVSASGVKTSVTSSSVKLSWTAVKGATSYKVEKYASGKWSTVTTTTQTTATVTGLAGYTSYSFRITALRKVADGSTVAAAPVTVKAKTTLGTPSSLTATYTATTITLTWSKVNNAAKYSVQQYTGGKWKTLKTVTGTSYKVSGLKTGTKYKFAVRAAVTETSGTVYGSRKEITQYSGLAKPSKVSVSSLTTTSAKLSWSKVSKAETYVVYAYINGEWVKKGSTSKTAMTVKGLPTGKKTKLKVKATAKLGGKTINGSYSSEVTALTLPAKVSSLKATVRKTTSITMTWKKTTGATSYQVYRYSGGKWKKIATTSKTTYTDSKSLKKGTEYKYKVRAVQKVNSKTTRYGAYSSVLKAKTTRFGTARF